MSEQIINKSLQVKLLECLKNTEMYPQLLECVAKEMANIEKKFFEISQIYNIESNNYNNLVNICDTFGYIPNMDIDGSFEMVRNEIKCIPQKIKSKTTYQGYNLILKQIKEHGESYNYFVSPDESGEKLCKSLNYQLIIDELNKSSLDNLFNKVLPNKNYAMNFEGNTPTLDYLVGRHIVNEIENSSMYLPYIDLGLNTTELEIRSLYEEYLEKNGITDDAEKQRIINEVINTINNVHLENYNRQLLGTYFKTVNKDLILRKYSLDKIIATSSWLLDSSTPIFSSNHIGVEYYPQNSYCVYRKTFGNMNDDEKTYHCKIDNVDDIKIKNGNPIINIYLNGKQKYVTFNVKDDEIEFFSQDSFNGKIARKDSDDSIKGMVEITFLDSYIKNILEDVKVNSLSDIEIIIEYGIKKFTTSDLFRYMDNGVRYNRRVCVVPHTGININTLCKKGSIQRNNLLETETWVSNAITLDNVKAIKSIYVNDDGNEYVYGTYPINSQEKYENENWMILQSYVKANDITDEIHSFDTSSNEIAVILNKKPIYPQFFEMQFQRGNEGYKIIKADKDGNLYGDKRDETIKNVLGKINYDEGIINFYKSYNQSLFKNLANSVSNLEPILYCKTVGTTKTWYKDENYSTAVEGTIDNRNSTADEKIFEYQVLGEEASQYNHIFNSESNEYSFYLERTLETEIQQFLVNTATSTDYLYAKNRDTSIYYSQIKCGNEDRRYVFVIKDENSGNVVYSNNTDSNKITIYRDLDCKNEIHIYKTTGNSAYSYVYSLGDNNNKYTDLTFSSIYDGEIGNKCDAVLSKSSESSDEIVLIQQSFKVSDSTFDLNEVANYCPYHDVLVSTFSYTLIFDIPDNFDDPIKNSFILNCNLRDVNSGDEQNYKFTFKSNWDHDESGDTFIQNVLSVNGKVTIIFDTRYVWFGSVNCEYTSMVDLHINEETESEESKMSKYPLKFNYKTSNSLNVNKISFVDDESNELAYIKFPEVEFDNIKNHISAFIGIKL